MACTLPSSVTTLTRQLHGVLDHYRPRRAARARPLCSATRPASGRSSLGRPVQRGTGRDIARDNEHARAHHARLCRRHAGGRLSGGENGTDAAQDAGDGRGDRGLARDAASAVPPRQQFAPTTVLFASTVVSDRKPAGSACASLLDLVAEQFEVIVVYCCPLAVLVYIGRMAAPGGERRAAAEICCGTLVDLDAPAPVAHSCPRVSVSLHGLCASRSPRPR